MAYSIRTPFLVLVCIPCFLAASLQNQEEFSEPTDDLLFEVQSLENAMGEESEAELERLSLADEEQDEIAMDLLEDEEEEDEDEEDEEENCPGCARAGHMETPHRTRHNREETDEEEMRLLRLEMIKQQILTKLRLTTKPNITFPRPYLPEPLLGMENIQSDEPPHPSETEEYYGKTTQVILFANEVPYCSNTRSWPTGCFRFSFKENLPANAVTSAELWVYKIRDPGDLHNQTLVISELGGPNHSTTRPGKIVGVQDTSLKRGWVNFDLKHTVRRWLHKPYRNHGIEVSCKTCQMDESAIPVATKAELKPFLVLNIGKDRHNRYKRQSINCERNTVDCCRERLTVNFTEMGWDNWIIEPQAYNAYYCKGSCVGVVQPGYNHSTILQTLAIRRRRQEITPCCSPASMSSMSVLYIDDSGQLIKKDLPGMIVESCRCA